MTQRTLDDGGAQRDDLLERLASTQALFADIRQELETLRDGLKSGEGAQSDATAKRLKDIWGAIGQCIKSEADIERLRDDRRGYVEGRRPLDMEQARSEVRCALDRLRDCRDTGCIPE